MSIRLEWGMVRGMDEQMVCRAGALAQRVLGRWPGGYLAMPVVCRAGAVARRVLGR